MIDTMSLQLPHQEDHVDATNSSIAHGSVCDRRLSRAARSLLHRHLAAVLASDSRDNPPSVWQLLEESLAPGAYQDQSQCPLLPLRDLLRYHEENSIVRNPPPQKAKSRMGLSLRNAIYSQTKRNWMATSFYQCGLCGKMFSSRYYLDLHLDHRHSHQVVPLSLHSPQPANLICPATIYCRALPSCWQRALEQEPYYGPGSGGVSPFDRSIVHRSLQSSTSMSCDDAVLKESQQRCYEMMEACFEANGAVRTYLETSICGRINCPDQLHQWFFAATARSSHAAVLMSHQVHEWQDEWEDYYAKHHTLGRLGVLLLVGLGLWYLRFLWQTLAISPTKALQRRGNPKGSRLLSKTSTSSNVWKKAQKSLGWGSGKPKSKPKVH